MILNVSGGQIEINTEVTEDGRPFLMLSLVPGGQVKYQADMPLFDVDDIKRVQSALNTEIERLERNIAALELAEGNV